MICCVKFRMDTNEKNTETQVKLVVEINEEYMYTCVYAFEYRGINHATVTVSFRMGQTGTN